MYMSVLYSMYLIAEVHNTHLYNFTVYTFPYIYVYIQQISSQ